MNLVNSEYVTDQRAVTVPSSTRNISVSNITYTVLAGT